MVVLVALGICHSDLATYSHGRVGVSAALGSYRWLLGSSVKPLFSVSSHFLRSIAFIEF